MESFHRRNSFYFYMFLFQCFLIHFQPLYNNSWVFYSTTNKEILFMNIFNGILLMLYPLCGWITEIYKSNMRVIIGSHVLSVLDCLVAALAIGITLAFSDPSRHYAFIYMPSVAFLICLTYIGLGMYEANALQLALDGMLEASSSELSSFIHWYFWCTFLGSVIAFYIGAGIFFLVRHCFVHYAITITAVLNHYLGMGVTILSTIQLLLHLSGVIVVIWIKKYLSTEIISRNSLKIIYKVLQFSYNHKYPVKRSAFTYWENDLPSRIDLGKDKYGGPFTYEQVEDVKTFFRLLLLILSLFGFHLLGDGYSFSYYVMNMYGCPTAVPLIFIIINPKHVPILVVLIGVPLYRVIKKLAGFRFPSMLTIIHIGLWVSLLAQAVLVLYSLLLPAEKREFKCPEMEFAWQSKTTKTCILANIDFVYSTNSSTVCHHFCTESAISEDSWILYVSLVYLILRGVANLLVFMTVLEFICAQSPRAVTGLLIGIWYSTTSIKHFITNVLDILPVLQQPNTWPYYNGIKGLMIFVSIILFLLVRRNYRYRERNEVVNEQAIIEEQYERELLMNEDKQDDGESYSD